MLQSFRPKIFSAIFAPFSHNSLKPLLTTTSSSFLDPLKRANFVFIRRDARRPPLTPLYHGPYKVIERGSKTFRLKMGDKEDVVSVDRLKATFSEADPTQVSPPRRGRPKKLSLYTIKSLLSQRLQQRDLVDGQETATCSSPDSHGSSSWGEVCGVNRTESIE